MYTERYYINNRVKDQYWELVKSILKLNFYHLVHYIIQDESVIHCVYNIFSGKPNIIIITQLIIIELKLFIKLMNYLNVGIKK